MAETFTDAVKSPNNGNSNLLADGAENKEPDKVAGDCNIDGVNESEKGNEKTKGSATGGRQISVLMYAAEHRLFDFAKKFLDNPTGKARAVNAAILPTSVLQGQRFKV